MSNHLTPTELARETGLDRRDVISKCVEWGVPIFHGEIDRSLFVSNLEANVLLAAAPPFQQPVSGDFCPFQVDNLCTAREPRPLGCRVYFCDPAYQDTGNAISETFLRRLKALAEEHAIGWRYAPLHHFLNEAEGRGPTPEATSTRLPLVVSG